MAAAPFVTNASDIVETKNIHRILLLKHAPFCETFHLYKVILKKKIKYNVCKIVHVKL